MVVFSKNGVGRKEGTQMLCLSWHETDEVVVRGPAESHSHMYVTYIRWNLVDPFVIFTQETNQKQGFHCIWQSEGDAEFGALIHTVCHISSEYHACHWKHHLLLQQMWQSHTQSHSRSYTPKSLRLLQLGATIKTVVALVTILKRLPSDWSRHIQSRGQILFIKRAKTSAQLLLLKAPTMSVFCVLFNTRQGHTVIITRGCAFFYSKLFLN